MMMKPTSAHDHLKAALSGDQQAFALLVEPYRNELIAHCYRFTGSMQDAEDMVQETMLRAWRKLDSYAGRASFRAWAYKIATNVCLDNLRKQRKRTLPAQAFPAANPTEPFAVPRTEPMWLEPFPDEWLAGTTVSAEARYSRQENISLAFAVALQQLAPRQRAVLLLRDVLGWRAHETADALEMSLSAANSALFRARKTLEKVYPGTKSPLATNRDDLLDRYMQAWEQADIDGLVGLIKEDAQFSMPPSPSWYQGRQAIHTMIAKFLFAGDARGRWRLLPTTANALPAFAFYQRDEDTQKYMPFGIQVVEFSGSKISTITHFLHHGLFPLFGMLETIHP
jgi:RNA polymerase sigma-70 factor, ECF subfamily